MVWKETGMVSQHMDLKMGYRRKTIIKKKVQLTYDSNNQGLTKEG